MKREDIDMHFMRQAHAVALNAEAEGNLPIGAVIVLDGEVIAEGGSAVIEPRYHPGRHAEMEALDRVPVGLWARSREMTCYTTLEPCLMCFGAMLLHGIGRIVFGADDPEGGASTTFGHLPPYYAHGRGVPEWTGPVMPEECNALYERARERFDQLPCGRAAS